jgi:GxxExxY protein
MKENEISYQVRAAIFQVYNILGPGLLESVYVEALAYELAQSGLDVEMQVPLKVSYKNLEMSCGFRADLLVNKKVIVEVKSVESLMPVHHNQLITYLKASNLRLGLLVNFNTVDLQASIIRKVNGLRD